MNKLVIAGLLLVAAVVYLIIGTTGSTAHYYVTVEELQNMGDQALNRGITVSGAILGDTIDYDPTLPRLTFTIVQVPADPTEVERAGGQQAIIERALADPSAPRLEIVYNSAKPDRLEHSAQPILRGRLQADGRFYAQEILLACPSRYQGSEPSAEGGQ